MNTRIQEWLATGLIIIACVVYVMLAGCAEKRAVRYENDPNHYPYYRLVEDHGSVGFVPKGNGVIVGGPRDGAIVHNDKVYHIDGSIEFRR